MSEELDRSALLIYLKNCRDLEVAKWKLAKVYEKKTNEFNARVAQLNEYYQWTEFVPLKSLSPAIKKIILWFCIIIPASIFLYLSIRKWIPFLWKTPYSHIRIMWVLVSRILILVVLVLLCCLSVKLLYDCIFFEGVWWINPFKTYKEDLKNNQEAKKENKKREQYNREWQNYYNNNQKLLPGVQSDWTIEKQNIENEQARIQNLLNEAYSLNWIPDGLRDLAPMYEIYKFMKSSRCSLDTAIISSTVKEGIRTLLDKLDVVIAQNEQLIIQGRRMERKIDDIGKKMDKMGERFSREIYGLQTEIKSKNIEILESLQRNEVNSRLSADYSFIAANYSKADYAFNVCKWLDEKL